MLLLARVKSHPCSVNRTGLAIGLLAVVLRSPWQLEPLRPGAPKPTAPAAAAEATGRSRASIRRGITEPAEGRADTGHLDAGRLLWCCWSSWAKFAWKPLMHALHEREKHLEHVLIETERARNESEAHLDRAPQADGPGR